MTTILALTFAAVAAAAVSAAVSGHVVTLARAATPPGVAAVPPRVIAITGVHVIPMDRARVIERQTVVIRDGVIAAVGPAATTAVPREAVRVNGRGRWLIPGLTDMHAHLMSDGAFPDSLAGDELMVMLANGVTTARLVIGTPEHLDLRRRVAAGALVGPRLFVASPQLAGRAFGEPHFNGYAVPTPDAARDAVRKAKAAGYDFIKLTFFISRPVYDAVIDEARAQSIRVVGHVDPQVGLARAFEARQQIEHLDAYLEAALADSSPIKRSVSGVDVWRRQNWESLDHVDQAKVARLGGETARNGIWVTPTLTFLKLAFGTGQTDEEIRSRPDWRFLPASKREEMAGPRNNFWSSPPSAERRAAFVRTRDALTKAIVDSGGKILAGSDAPEWFLHYGWTLHRELESLVAAGLTPYQALLAATRNPAEFLGVAESSGTIARGKRADLVLLDANPLARIGNSQRIAGVVANGSWLDRAELNRRLGEIEKRFAAVK